MKYRYAVINDVGRCYEVQRSTNYVCDKHYVPIGDLIPVYKYLSKYYHPIPNIVDRDSDFLGKWYADVSHTIEEVSLNGN